MKTVHKSVLIWYSPQEMFALVTDVEKYPQFLPWCDRAQVLERGEHGMKAEVGIALGGLRKSFVTHNTHEAEGAGRRVKVELVEGPFSHLDGDWHFHPVGDGSERACKVELHLHYGFNNRALAALVGPVFDRIAATFVDAFVQRAEQVYG